MDHNAVVTINNLSFLRGTRFIFKDVNISIPSGKITAILGPSGTGKTTLLRLISGELTPESGSIEVLNENVHQLNKHDLYQLRQRMGLLFQNGALFTDISVFENVAFPLREHTKLAEDMIHDIVLMKLQAVGLRGAQNLMPNELSGGMARRVALARAIVMDPEIIMYDEPFTGQDPISKGVLVNLIRTINQSLNTTTILVTHDINEALALADYVYFIADSKIEWQGAPKDLPTDHSAYIYQFLHGLPDGTVPFHYPAIDYAKDLHLEPIS